MNRYFEYRWEETSGGEFDDWGFSNWYLETDQELYPLRQIVVYDNGSVLKYDENHFIDEFGMLPDQSVTEEELKESNTLEISKDEFEDKWLTLNALNRK
jgi:hypothetical protein